MVQVGAGVAQGAYSWLPIKAYLFPSLICACILLRFLDTPRYSMLPGTLIDYVLTSCAVRDRLVRCRVAATGRLLKCIFSRYVKYGTPADVVLCTRCPSAMPSARRTYLYATDTARGGSGNAKSGHNGLSLKACLFTYHIRPL